MVLRQTGTLSEILRLEREGVHSDDFCVQILRGVPSYWRKAAAAVESSGKCQNFTLRYAMVMCDYNDIETRIGESIMDSSCAK